ncbi:Trehalose-6-P synthase/phosphatase complex subunit [Diplodia intermedia]|uniref:Trehalose-6-P synthase/phosphatase complex subunit n=1 Tax=Diplodia intermedia TaxID=856260 RepID=A0ABR3TP61_9PEZI
MDTFAVRPTIVSRLDSQHNAEEGTNSYDALAVWVDDNDLDGHYAHYCKTILWPVFHYQIPNLPKSKAYEDHSCIYYEHVNQAFADKIVKSYKRGDVTWIHSAFENPPSVSAKSLSDIRIPILDPGIARTFGAEETIFHQKHARSYSLSFSINSNAGRKATRTSPWRAAPPL